MKKEVLAFVWYSANLIAVIIETLKPNSKESYSDWKILFIVLKFMWFQYNTFEALNNLLF